MGIVQHTLPNRSLDARRVYKDSGEGWSIAVQYGMDYNPGQSNPLLFTITVNFEKHGARQLGPYMGLVERYAPTLADLIPWHLCDADGLPVNYEGMAAYWSDFAIKGGTHGDSLRLPDNCSTYDDALAKSLRCTQVGDRLVLDRILRQWREDQDSTTFFSWIEERKPKLREGFINACHRHDLDRIEIEVPVGEPYVVSAQARRTPAST